MSTPLDAHLITTKEASERSGYNPDYLARLCRSGKIVGRQIGRAWIVDERSLASFVREQDARKEARAKELAREREAEYRRAQQPELRAASDAPVRTIPLAPVAAARLIARKPAKPLVFSPAFAFAISVIATSSIVIVGNAPAFADGLSRAGAALIAFAYSDAASGPPRLLPSDPRSPSQVAEAYLAPAVPSYAVLEDGLALSRTSHDLADAAAAHAVARGPRIDLAGTAARDGAEYVAAGADAVAAADPSALAAHPAAPFLALARGARQNLDRTLAGELILEYRAGGALLSAGAHTRDFADDTARANPGSALAQGLLDGYDRGMHAWAAGSLAVADTGSQLEYGVGDRLVGTAGLAAALAGGDARQLPGATQDFALAVAGNAVVGAHDLLVPSPGAADTWSEGTFAAVVLRAAPWFVPEPAYRAGAQVALAVYGSLHGLVDEAGHQLALLFGNPTTDTKLVDATPAAPAQPASAASSPATTTPAAPVLAGDATANPVTYQGGTVVRNVTYVTNNFSYAADAVTRSAFDASLDSFASSERAPSVSSIVDALKTSDLTVNSFTTTNVAITGALNADTITATNAINGAYFTAASVTATSTLPNLSTNSFALTSLSDTSSTYNTLIQNKDALPLLAIRDNGSIGIGTSTPQGTLHVVSATSPAWLTVQTTAANGNARFELESGDGHFWNLLTQASDGGLRFQDNGATSFFLGNGGTTGVGMVTSGALLDVASTTNSSHPYFRVSNGGATPYLLVDTTGNVGIGTSSPGSALSVQGQAYVTGTSLFGGDLTANGGIGAGQQNSNPGSILAVNNITTTGGQFVGPNAPLASAPVYSFTGDLSTGVTHPMNDAIGFNVGGSEVGRFDSSGFFGIGTTTPVAALAVNGNAFISNNLTVGNSLSVVNGSVNIGSASSTLTLGGYLGSSLVPSINKSYDLGSPALFWRNGYLDSLTVNTLSAASTTISGTSANSFTINSDNASSDTEDMSLIFFRGIVNPNAVLSWNSTLDRFEFNQPAYIKNQSTTTTVPTLTLQQASGQTADILDLLNSSGTNVLAATAAGNVGIGTTTPSSPLTVYSSGTAATFVSDGTGANPTTALKVLNGGVGTNEVDLVLQNAAQSDTYRTGLAFNNSTGAQVWDLYNTSNTFHLWGDQNARDVLTFAATGNTTIGAEGTNGSIILSPAGTGGVGIGTTSPTNRFEVAGNTFLGGNLTATGTLDAVERSNGWTTLHSFLASDNTSSILQVNNGSNLGLLALGFQNTPSIGAYNTGALNISGFSAANSASPTPLATFNFATGNVGIGTTTPGNKLDVYGNVAIGTAGSGGYIYGDTTNPYLRLSNLAGTVLGYGASNSITLGGAIQFMTNSVIQGGFNGQGGFYVGPSSYQNANVGIGNVAISGKVGIGTSSPQALLQLDGVTGTTLMVSGQGNTDYSSVIRLTERDTNYLGNYIKRDGANDRLVFGTHNALDTNTANDTDILTLTSAGNVGIGTTSPMSKLSIVGNGSSGNSLFLSNNSVLGFGLQNTGNEGSLGFIRSTPSNVFDIHTSGYSYPIQIDASSIQLNANGSTGNVGIGTTSPYKTFSVTGGVAFNTGNVNFDNTTGTQLNFNTTPKTTQLIVDSNGNFSVNDATAGVTWLYDSNGKLGIGNYYPSGNLPQNKLSVNGSVSIGFPTNGDVAAPPNGLLVNGNVGIGTTTPADNLDVYVPNDSGLAKAGLIRGDGAGYLTQWTYDTSGRGFLEIGENESFNSSGSTRVQFNTGAPSWLQQFNSNTDSYFLGRMPAGGSTVTQFLTINNQGNVGIGSTSPAATLAVQGNALVSGTLTTGTLAATSTITAPGIVLSGASSITLPNGGSIVGSGAASFSIGDSNDTVSFNGTNSFDANNSNVTASFTNSGSGDIARFYKGSTEILTAANNGNVGIGSTSPAATLAVQGNGAESPFYVSTTTVSAIPALYVNSSGNVGVNTANPRNALEVQGTVEITKPGNPGWNSTLSADANGNLLLSHGIVLGTGDSIYNNSTYGSYYNVGNYGHTISTLSWGGFNSNAVGLSYNQPSMGPTIDNVYDQRLLSFTGTVNSTGRVTARGLYTSLTDNSASIGNTLVGLTADVSGGTNTSATRYAALLLGGNVGIGTTTPGDTLQISNFNGAALRIQDSNSSTGGDLRISQVGTKTNFYEYSAAHALLSNPLTLDGSTGYLGVGTTSPKNLLSIQGSSDANQLTVVGAATQTKEPIILENASGTPMVGLSYTGTNGSVGGLLNIYGGNNNIAGYLSADSGGTIAGLDIGEYNNVNFKNRNPGAAETTFTNGTAAAPIPWDFKTYNGATFYFSGYGGQGGEVVMRDLSNGAETFHSYLSSGNYKTTFPTGNVGVGTTSPYAALSVMGGGDYGSHPVSTLFAVGSSTAGTATSTLLSLTSDGAASLAGPLTLLNNPLTTVGEIKFADSVGNVSTNIQGGSSGTLFLGGTSLNFGVSSFTSGNNINWGLGNRSFTITSSGTQSFGVIGGAVGTVPLYLETGSGQTANLQEWRNSSGVAQDVVASNFNVGIGTTSPWAQLSVNPNGTSGPAFAIGSSTGTYFQVSNGGVTTVASGNGVTGVAALTFNGLGSSFGFYEADASNIGLTSTNNTGAQIAFSNSSGIKLNSTDGLYWSTSGSAIGTSDIGLRRLGANTLALLTSTTNGASFTPAGTLLTGQEGIGTTTPWGQLSASSTSANPALAVEQKGTGAAAIFQGGNVGIGTANPLYGLHVSVSDNTSNSIADFQNPNTGSSAFADVKIQSDTANLNIGVAGSNTGTSGVVQDATYSYLEANNTSAGLDLAAVKSTGVIRFFTGGPSNLVGEFDSLGRFGIGTPSPSFKLDVAGGINTDQYSGYYQGGQLLAYASTSNQSTVLGLGAGNAATTTGSGSLGATAIGYMALESETATAVQNTAVGALAAQKLTNQTGNTAVGYSALQNVATSNNTAVGIYALEGNPSLTGSGNTGIGASTLGSLQSGTANASLGAYALDLERTGSFNIALGYQSNPDTTSGDYNIVLGSNIEEPSRNGSRQLNIGNVLYGTNLYNNTSVSSAPTTNATVGVSSSSPSAEFAIHAVNGSTEQNLFTIGSSTASATTTLFNVTNQGLLQFGGYGAGTLQTDSSGNVTVSSDARLKNIYATFDRGLTAIEGLQPELFHWNAISGLNQQDVNAGFIAQNVQQYIPEAVGKDQRGYLTLQDRPILAAAVNAIKQLAASTTQNTLDTGSLTAQVADVAQQAQAAQQAATAAATLPADLTASRVSADTLTAGNLTAQDIQSFGNVTASAIVVPTAPTQYLIGSTTVAVDLPSAVLTASSSVDLYKLATYGLARTIALEGRFDALSLKVDDLESRVAALESASSTAFGLDQLFATSTAQQMLASVGFIFSNGYTELQSLVADTLTVGTSQKPTGVTLYDEQTGKPYCVSIKGGQQQITQGACAVVDLAAQQAAAQSGPQIIVTSGTMTITGTTTAPAGTTAGGTGTGPSAGGTAGTTGSTTSATGTGGAGSTSGTASSTPAAPSDTTPPVVTLNGAAAVQIDQGQAWNDPGATAVDDVDGDLTAAIVVSGAVNVDAPGLYTVTYSATDKAGNTGSVSRTVVVQASAVATAAPASTGTTGTTGTP